MRKEDDTPSKPTKVAEGHPIKPVTVRIDDFSAMTGIGRSSIYELIRDKKLKSVVIAGRRLIPASEADRLLQEALAA